MNIVIGISFVLVAHNGHVFDDKHQIRARNRTGLTDDFKSNLAGFSDTLPAFCKLYPGISHKQSDLYVSIDGGNIKHTVHLMMITVSKIMSNSIVRNL